MTIKLSELAKLANVSKTTASFVLNEEAERHGIKPETIRRVREIAAKHGYVPNLASRNLRKGRQHLIGFVAPQVTDTFYLGIAQSIEQTAEALGYQVLFGSTFSDDERERRYLESLIARRVDGLILLPNDINSPHLDLLHQHEVPTILFRRRASSRRPFRFMTFNDQRSMYLATRHLLDRGCQRVALLLDPGAENRDWYRVIIKARLAGYTQALKEAGLDAAPFVHRLQMDHSDAPERFTAFLHEHRIDGVVATEDVCILRILNALHAEGYRIPRDIKLVGCDNNPYTSYLFPPLSSIGFPQADLGKRMIEELVEAITTGKAPTGELLLEPHLVERESSAAQ